MLQGRDKENMARTGDQQNAIDVTRGWATEMGRPSMTPARRRQGATELNAVVEILEKEWMPAPTPDQFNAINVTRGWARELGRPSMTAARRRQGSLEMNGVLGVLEKEWPPEAPAPDLPFT